MIIKKILFISGIQIFPPESGGQLRSANFCRSLSTLGNPIDIYSFTGRKNEYLKFKKSSEGKIQNAISEYVNRNSFFGMIQFVFYHLKWPPVWLTWLTHLFLPRELKRKIDQCDLILLDFPYLYPISKYSKKCFRVNTHNAEFELFGNNLFISHLVKKIEMESFRRAQHIFFCNSSDREKYVMDLPALNSKSSILPNGLELSLFKKNDKWRDQVRSHFNIASDKNVILFTGSQYPPNWEAFKYLLEWSQSQKEKLNELNILIMIVGTVSVAKINETYFKVIGKVRDVLPFFSSSDFGINPVEWGSGTNVKMIEYMAAQLPLITTTFGGRGLDLTDRHTCWCFERATLLSVLSEVVQQSASERKLMAQQAYNKNFNKIDMPTALRGLQLEW